MCYEDAGKEAQCACVLQPHLTWLDLAVFFVLLLNDLYRHNFEVKECLNNLFGNFFIDFESILKTFIKNLTKNTTKTNFLLTFWSLSEIFIRWSWYSELPVLDTLRKLRVKKTVVAVAEGAKYKNLDRLSFVSNWKQCYLYRSFHVLPSEKYALDQISPW